jgi:4-hydroxy-3-polyprenylbenzoate decarboxylase
MAYKSLESFIDALDEAGELKRIPVPVATELEITEIADREMKSPGGGQALLFEKPTVDGKESAFPLVINSMGSRRRMAMALGLENIDELMEQMAYLMKAKPPKTLKQAVELARNGMDVIHARPVTRKDGPVKEVIHKFPEGAEEAEDGFSLRDLPILQCWPQDGGRFITLPTVYTEDPDTGDRNVGMYRMQVYSGSSTGMHWQVHKVGARHGKRYYEKNEPMPVAVVLGGDPAYTFSATAPLPDGLDEILFAGFSRKKSVPLIKCETSDLMVPADADFILEGTVRPGEMLPEGPFGDHTGFYTPVDDFPVFRLKAITHRKNALYPATIVGQPPMEDFYMGEASVRLFLPIFKMNFPEIVDMALPAEGVFHNLVFVSIKKQYAWQAYKIMHGLWGMGQMMFTKYIVVVDDDCDVHNTSEVLFRLCANTDPQRDTVFTKNPADELDHAPTVRTLSTHMGFDATKKLPTEGYTRPWPDLVTMPREVKNRVDKLLSRIESSGE